MEKESFTEMHPDIQNKCFNIVTSRRTLQYQFVLELVDAYKPIDYVCHLLFGLHSNENNIYQVYTQSKRIGWIFPIQSLLSVEHDYATNPHFLKYAYIATHFLLETAIANGLEDMPNSFSLEDIFSPEKVVLVLCKESCQGIAEFNLDNYVVSLYENGYAENEMGSNIEPPALDTRLNLICVSDQVKDNPFITELFSILLPNSGMAPVTRFHLLYQIIELLINDIFDNEFLGIIGKLEEERRVLFDIKDELTRITGEKHRVKALFNRYAQIENIHLVNLSESCRRILIASNRKTFELAPENIYAVRCLLFHDYRAIPVDSRIIIDEINKDLLDVLIQMLYKFTTVGRQQ